ncbi:MBL fold metallo-hydrolase, partial [bacterium]|nr:MBL fold metallo-hydrolase [bacterium]
MVTRTWIGAIAAMATVAALAGVAQGQPPPPRADGLNATFRGPSGPLPVRDRAKPCVAIQAAGSLYLVDIGPEATENLQLWRMPLADARAVFVTHLHSDHIGDLGEFNMQSWVAGRSAPLAVVGPAGTDRLAAGLHRAYGPDHQFRHAHHEHGDVKFPLAAGELRAQVVTLPAKADDHGVRSRQVWSRDGLVVTAIAVEHSPASPAFAYRFDYKGRSVVVSGDTIKWPPLAQAAKGADVLIHEAQNNDMTRNLAQGLKGLGQTIVGIITRFPLLTAAVVATGAAFTAYEMLGRRNIESLDDILKEHEANIRRLGDAYDEVKKHEKAYAQGDSAITVNFLNAQELKKAEDLARSQLQDAFDRIFRNLKLGGGFDTDTQVTNGTTTVGKIADALQKVTSVDMSKFNSDVSKIGTLNPDLAGTASELLNIFTALTKTVDAFPQLSGQVSDADVKFAELQQAISRIDSDSAQKALQDLLDKAKSGESGVGDVTSALQTLENTNLTLAGPIAALEDLFKKAVAAKNALNPQSQLPTLGTIP